MEPGSSSPIPPDASQPPHDLTVNAVTSEQPSHDQPTPDAEQQSSSRETEQELFEEVEEVSVKKGVRIIRKRRKKLGKKVVLNYNKSCKEKSEDTAPSENCCSFDEQDSLSLGETTVNQGVAQCDWQFQESVVEGICEMLVANELPFSEVDKKSFRIMMGRACPVLRIPCQQTVSDTVYQIYLKRKSRLRSFLKARNQRVSLTTDTWTSIQGDTYMCLAIHFIGGDWIVKKGIINFCLKSGHTGEIVAQDIDKCLREWGIEKIMTITVDNDSSNDTAPGCLIKRLDGRGNATILGGKYMHIRCTAQIIDLMVQDVLKSNDNASAISRIRSAVKYVRDSHARYKKFKECIALDGSKTKKSLCLDVPTQWKSTYMMLRAAVELRKAFDSYEIVDLNFARDLDKEMPSPLDWDRAEKIVMFLEPCKKLTNAITSNMVFKETCAIEGCLTRWLHGSDNELKGMATTMKEIYDKYWGSIEKMNKLYYYAVILDPRCKWGCLEFVLEGMYITSPNECKGLKEEIWDGFNELFNEYKRMYEQEVPTITVQKSTVGSSSFAGARYEVDDKFMRWRAQQNKQVKSELDKYLQDDLEDEVDVFDILKWWKVESRRFPILSNMARDILAVPVSTVGRRVLNEFKSSLTPKIVQAVICCQDWLQANDTPISTKKNLAKLEKRKKVLEDFTEYEEVFDEEESTEDEETSEELD